MLLPTLKEVPAEAEALSHILMIRAGLIRKLTSGVYSYLPLGLMVLKKIETIIIEEMNSKGAQQVLLPAIQPIELWVKSGRYESLGEDMITFTDRHKKTNVLGPTHEEVITTLVKNEVNSYRQLPLILYQIQTKFRDEARPRFGVIRSREFIMKDAYSFDASSEGLNASYQKMYDAYTRIFTRCGLGAVAVEADTGVMGGEASHEFMVLAESGEDKIVRCQGCGYAASSDKAECPGAAGPEPAAGPENLKALAVVSTPGASSVKDVADLLGVKASALIKTIVYISDGIPVAVLVRGDHDVNETKLTRVLKARQLVMADAAVIQKVTKGPLGFSGPVGLSGVSIIADYAVQPMANAVVGANKEGAHCINANRGRDYTVAAWADVRTVTADDCCPRCKGTLLLCQAIEVGHVFKLGTKYTDSLQATFLDEQGKAQKIIMGCYGIGVTRIIAACIEKNHDANGIIWPVELTPFQAIIMPLNAADQQVKAAGEDLYAQFLCEGIETLYDDRDIRAGIKFKDADLIGAPLQVIIGEKNLAHQCVEIKIRKTGERITVDRHEVVAKAVELLKG